MNPTATINMMILVRLRRFANIRMNSIGERPEVNQPLRRKCQGLS